MSQTHTRTEAFAAAAALNAVIDTLKNAALIKDATYSHEIDNGYSALETAADIIPVLASRIHWSRKEVFVAISEGRYDNAVDGARRCEGNVHGLRNIEMRCGQR